MNTFQTADQLGMNEIIAHFATSKDGPGEDWARDDAFTSYCLDHRAKDGTKFWIDLEDDGTISILWKPAGQEKPIVKRFMPIRLTPNNARS